MGASGNASIARLTFRLDTHFIYAIIRFTIVRGKSLYAAATMPAPRKKA